MTNAVPGKRHSNISIAMATYNGQTYLAEQLESIAAQDLLPLELIITDDASADGTPEIIASFARRAPFPVRFYANPERLGYAENFLRATSLCAGKFVAFSDQDDVWHPEKLARVAAEFASSDCDVVIHTTAVVDETLVPNGLLHPPVRERVVVGPGGFDPWVIVPGMAMVAKQELFTVVDPAHRPNARLTEDVVTMKHDEWLYFIGTALGKVVLIPDALVKYRQHGGNAMGPPAALSSRARSQLARRAGRSAYELLGRRALSYAGFLRGLAVTQEPYAARLRASVAFYERVADRLRLRSSLYGRDVSLPQRAKILAKLIASGAYRKDKAGALTLRSLAKDSLRTIGVFAAR
jgi:glycosyltransferase involved in cell wall biosynthesis